MNSDQNPIHAGQLMHPFLVRIREERAERETWEVANPELTRDWNEARGVESARCEAEAEARRKLRVDLASLDAVEACGAPARCSVAIRGVVEETPAVQAVNAFVGGGDAFLLLLGKAGVGKSVAAAHGLRCFVRNRMETATSWLACFERAADLARLSQYDSEAQEHWRDVKRAGFLVIDDLGAEQTNSSWLALLDELIDYRYGEYLQTILTTNLEADAFKARYGERISDRIRHAGVVCGAGRESLRASNPGRKQRSPGGTP